MLAKNTPQVIIYVHTTYDIKSHNTNNFIQQNLVIECLHNTYHIQFHERSIIIGTQKT